MDTVDTTTPAARTRPTEGHAVLVAERDTDDGMVELTFEMDPAFEAEMQAAADARGLTLQRFMEVAILKGIRKEVEEGVRQGTTSPEEAQSLLAQIAQSLGDEA